MNARFRKALKEAYQANHAIYADFQQYDATMGKFAAEDMLSYSLSRTCLQVPDEMEKLHIACGEGDITKSMEICRELERILRDEHGIRPYHAVWAINCWMYAIHAHICYFNAEYAQMIEAMPSDKIIPLANSGDAYASAVLYSRDMSQKEWLAKTEQYDHPVSIYYRSAEMRGDFSDAQRNQQALALCLEAMDRGYVGVCSELARIYQGVEGVEKNAAEAFKYALMGADHGIHECMNMVAEAYLRGDGVEANPQASFAYLEKLAEAGDAKAQRECACAYYEGDRGAIQNLEKSFYWVKKSADQGDSEAQFLAGVALMNGTGVPANGSEALHYFKGSAEKGNVKAMEQIGGMYFRGEEIPRNEEESAAWYKKAAEAGSGFACSLLADLYEYGIGVPQNRARADWYKRRAEELGYHESKEADSSKATDAENANLNAYEGCDFMEIGKGDGYSDIQDPKAKELVVCIINAWNEMTKIAFDSGMRLLNAVDRQYLYMLIKLSMELANKSIANLPFYLTKMAHGSACSRLMEGISEEQYGDEVVKASERFSDIHRSTKSLKDTIIRYLYDTNVSVPMAGNDVVEKATVAQVQVIGSFLKALLSIVE